MVKKHSTSKSQTTREYASGSFEMEVLMDHLEKEQPEKVEAPDSISQDLIKAQSFSIESLRDTISRLINMKK